MSEKITGEQLEASAGRDKPVEVTCHECGTIIDCDNDTHYISRDGERFCCSDCDGEITRLSSIKYTHSNEWGGSAEHGKGFDRICVEVRARSQAEALKKAEEYGQITNEGVNAYLEVC